MKIVVISHSSALDHPGGAETAAANHVAVMRSFGHDVTHIACKPDLEQDFGYDKESGVHLIRSSTHDGSFIWSEPRMAMLWRSQLKRLEPDVVHLHHYLNIGVILPSLIKQILPNCRVVLTLHEYLAICGMSGAMVTEAGSLCFGSGIQKCARCLNTTTKAVAINRNIINTSFGSVDQFISPSYFLRDRYLAWGLNSLDLIQIPNFLNPGLKLLSNRHHSGPRKYVYLGQHTPLKGLDVLLQACTYLQDADSSIAKLLYLDIWGSGAKRWPEYQSRIKQLVNELGDFVRFRGPYEPKQLPSILANASYCLVPSIWWENAPMVISESLSAGVPIIGTDIGGIREALVDSSENILFELGNAYDLAAAIRKSLLQTPSNRTQVASVAESNKRIYEAHLSIYEVV